MYFFAEINATASGSKLFGFVKNGSNYLCDAKQKLPMSNNVTAMFKNVELQPFSKKVTIDTKGMHVYAEWVQFKYNTHYQSRLSR